MTCESPVSLHYWFNDVTCPQGGIPDANGFHGKGFPSDARAQAEAECQAACDADSRCVYAGLHFYFAPMDPDWTHCASCYFYSDACGHWQTFMTNGYSLYVKAGEHDRTLLANSGKMFISKASTFYFAQIGFLAFFAFAISL